MKPNIVARYVGYVLLGSMLFACASSVITQPATLTPLVDASTSNAPRLRVITGTIVTLDKGFRRSIPQNSLWRRVGTLPQGEVYRPVGLVFTIEGRQVHEAYLVLNDSTLAGFYLPGESAFSPLSHPPKLTIKKENND
ncbi:hypothetical protein [Herbaspirillum sp. alder98]|uniref:hypothetical protein n=1 Tax=Herbaspirillum sp. alder98 TaxID=2913096 RepID=UPI001CD8F8E7|nr:hypothetical protein [Herbaspirillum sp. alder98]MCA1324282.1 hypothetical protein [Herbaspirillum sp. alder98]